MIKVQNIWNRLSTLWSLDEGRVRSRYFLVVVRDKADAAGMVGARWVLKFIGLQCC
jgi:hypothetical protein